LRRDLHGITEWVAGIEYSGVAGNPMASEHIDVATASMERNHRHKFGTVNMQNTANTRLMMQTIATPQLSEI
tara:strand:+ start:474 stop:689 length:216 start_codon:yes stop_codon:yes gene_type:complete